jgi:hypothetical protein
VGFAGGKVDEAAETRSLTDGIHIMNIRFAIFDRVGRRRLATVVGYGEFAEALDLGKKFGEFSPHSF